MICQSSRHGLSGLTRFSGRDGRGRFWPYALAVVGVTFVVLSVGMAATMSAMLVDMQAFAVAHPDQAVITTGPGSYSIQIEGDTPGLALNFTPMAAAMGAGVSLAVLLLAAATTRRLHDSGRRGYWGLLPLPFLIVGISAFPRLMAEGDAASTGLFLALFVNNLIYLGTLVLLVVLLTQRSNTGGNRFGPPAS